MSRDIMRKKINQALRIAEIKFSLILFMAYYTTALWRQIKLRITAL